MLLYFGFHLNLHDKLSFKFNSREYNLKLDRIARIVKPKPTDRNFPDGPMAKTPHSQCRGPRFDP